MICQEFIDIDGKTFVKTFSDKGVFIRNKQTNMLYPVAYNSPKNVKEYEESDIIIENWQDNNI